MPMQETFFATRFGQLRDRFGINWMILHERPDARPHVGHFSNRGDCHAQSIPRPRCRSYRGGCGFPPGQFL